MVRISLEFDFTPEDVDSAVALLDSIQPHQETADDDPTTPLQLGVGGWYGHLGVGSRRFWEVAAKHAQDHPTWTFDDLATASGIDKETLRSYHRNSYRAIKDVEAADPLKKENWAGDHWIYSMENTVRDEILRLINEN